MDNKLELEEINAKAVEFHASRFGDKQRLYDELWLEDCESNEHLIIFVTYKWFQSEFDTKD